MYTVFLFCAIIAGTIFLFQFVLLLVGFGLEGADFDGDVPDGVDGDVDAPGDAGFDGAVDHETGMVDHGSTFLFGVISIRTVVAAVTMFGLVGMASLSLMESMEGVVVKNIYAIVLAAGGGLAAMFGVHYLMRTLHRLGADGKVRPRNAIGRGATVYLPIPGGNEGAGKIQIRMQGRLVELAAVSEADHELKTGTKVRVVGIVAGSTVRVKEIQEKANATEAVNVKA